LATIMNVQGWQCAPDGAVPAALTQSLTTCKGTCSVEKKLSKEPEKLLINSVRVGDERTASLKDIEHVYRTLLLCVKNSTKPLLLTCISRCESLSKAKPTCPSTACPLCSAVEKVVVEKRRIFEAREVARRDQGYL